MICDVINKPRAKSTYYHPAFGVVRSSIEVAYMFIHIFGRSQTPRVCLNCDITYIKARDGRCKLYIETFNLN